jgi:hypothetical protein
MAGSCPYTLKPQYNDPFSNTISAIKNLTSIPSIVNSLVKIPSNNKITDIKNKLFGPFRFIKLRFPCTTFLQPSGAHDLAFPGPHLSA